jgi:hypothetical protein
VARATNPPNGSSRFSVLCSAIGGLILAGCTQGAPPRPDPWAEVSARSERMVADAYAREQKRKVNENWNADCTTDAVTGVRRCFAGTFGQSMDARGNGFGGKNLPLQTYFVDQDGPFILVGTNTYPGRTPTIRLDDSEPMPVWNFGGTRPPQPQPELVAQFLDAQTARARFHVWPEGSNDMIVDLRGFGEAWSKLLGYVGGDAAPSDSGQKEQ